MLEMVGLERVGETDLLRVRTEFSNECIVFDREIQPRRNIIHLTVPSVAEQFGPYSPFHVCASKANILLLFRHSVLPTYISSGRMVQLLPYCQWRRLVANTFVLPSRKRLVFR